MRKKQVGVDFNHSSAPRRGSNNYGLDVPAQPPRTCPAGVPCGRRRPAHSPSPPGEVVLAHWALVVSGLPYNPNTARPATPPPRPGVHVRHSETQEGPKAFRPSGSGSGSGSGRRPKLRPAAPPAGRRRGHQSGTGAELGPAADLPRTSMIGRPEAVCIVTTRCAPPAAPMDDWMLPYV